MTATAQKIPAKAKDVARECLEKANGDVVEAANLLQKKVRRSQALRNEVTEPYVEQACYDHIRELVRKDRGRIWDVAVADTSGRVIEMARGKTQQLMDFPLPGGKPLRHACRDDVLSASDFYAKQAKNMGHKATWLNLIGQSLGPRDIVEKRFTEERLGELQNEAQLG